MQVEAPYQSPLIRQHAHRLRPEVLEQILLLLRAQLGGQMPHQEGSVAPRRRRGSSRTRTSPRPGQLLLGRRHFPQQLSRLEQSRAGWSAIATWTSKQLPKVASLFSASSCCCLSFTSALARSMLGPRGNLARPKLFSRDVNYNLARLGGRWKGRGYRGGAGSTGRGEEQSQRGWAESELRGGAACEGRSHREGGNGQPERAGSSGKGGVNGRSGVSREGCVRGEGGVSRKGRGYSEGAESPGKGESEE